MKRGKGFTLIEMMIVVAIIALLATIAIPNYVNFQLRAKTSEAKANLGAIRICEEAYKAEYGIYLACAPNPSSIPSGIKLPWESELSSSKSSGWDSIAFKPKGKVGSFNLFPLACCPAYPGGWDDIGFLPKGDVYYQYQVTNVTTTTFLAQAQSDLDGLGTPFSTFTLDQDGTLTSADPLK